MTRPKFFKDPIHGQIHYADVDLEGPPPPPDSADECLSWLVQKLIDTREFQRLRHIRQLGLANLVYHSAEHSRFAHSMGVAHVARMMFEKIVRNDNLDVPKDIKIQTIVAALLHDVGHGPFSHSMEEILEEVGTKFDHEEMTYRYITDPESGIYKIISEVDESWPNKIAAYFSKKSGEKFWWHKIVSSQLDADRLDYISRDLYSAGVSGHGFDFQRLMDFLTTIDNKIIGVDERAVEALESYLLCLDQGYRAVYYHQTVRAASTLLCGAIRRAVQLHREGAHWIFPADQVGASAIALLVEKGDKVPLEEYTNLNENHIWTMIGYWSGCSDRCLADLCDSILHRRLPKAIAIGGENQFSASGKFVKKASEFVKDYLGNDLENELEFYFVMDEPSRLSYKVYTWKSEIPEDHLSEDNSVDPILVALRAGGSVPLEDYKKSEIMSAIKRRKHFCRVFVPAKCREQVKAIAKEFGVAQ